MSSSSSSSASSSSSSSSSERQLQSLFYLVDRDRSGSISRHELGQLLRSLHLHFSQTEIDSLIQACDTNDDGEIDWSEFLYVMNQQQVSGPGREELIEAFRAFEGPVPDPVSPPALRIGSGALVGRPGVLNVELLEKAVELYHGPVTEASDERRRAIHDMIQRLRVDYGGGFHYEHVR